MYQDVKNIYSDDQAVTVTADSENTINQGSNAEAYKEQFLRISVTETFAGGTNLKIDLKYDSAVGFGTVTTLEVVPVTLTAALTAGTVLYSQRLPQGFKQYSKLRLTAVGTHTAGKIKAHLTHDVPQLR